MNKKAKTLISLAVRMVLVPALLVTSLTVTVAGAQDEEVAAPPTLILPVNGAQFLPGAQFDMRIETYGEQMPEDFAAAINGEAFDAFFGVTGVAESWLLDEEDEASLTANTMVWRDVILPAAGEYTVTVMADGEESTVTWTAREPQPSSGARNVILFIADGGSTAVYSAVRLVSRGMEAGVYNSNLVFEDFEEIGYLHTSGLDSIITDSANSISAYNTGHKSASNANGVYPDTSADALDDPRVEKFAYLADRVLGKSIGIVTNANWADATPNGVAGYGRDRSESSLNAYVTQPLDEGLLPEVILGGGARNMQPASAEGSRRTDERDVFADYEAAGYSIVTSGSELQAAVEGEALPERLLGIFHPNNMDTWLDRNVFTDNVANFPDQPGLETMTLAALNVLNQNENGFYLQIEAASVDRQLHPLDFDRALAEVIEFDRSIAAAVQWVEANAPDTLIVVTSDHAHSYDVYGTVDVEKFNAAISDIERRNAIGIYGDAGFPTYEDADGDFFPDNWAPSVVLAQGKVDSPVYTEDYQVSPTPRVPSLTLRLGEDQSVSLSVDNPDDDPNGLPLGGNLAEGNTQSVHTLQSVAVYAQGPGSDCLGRVQENIEVFFCMAAAMGIDPTAAE